METIILKRPLSVDGKELTEVTMRRAKVRDLKEAQRYGDDVATREVALIAILCGMIPDQLDEMDLADFNQIQKRFSAMLEGSGPVAGNGAARPNVPVPAERDRRAGA